jgi:hypothetical protein
MKTYKYLIIALLSGLPVYNVYAAKPNIIVIYADDMGCGDCMVNSPVGSKNSADQKALQLQSFRYLASLGFGRTQLKRPVA